MARRLRLDGDVVSRFAGVGAAAAGVAGAVTGLVIGLIVHPATAWFAAIELGAPSALLGHLIGAALGVVVAVGRSDPS